MSLWFHDGKRDYLDQLDEIITQRLIRLIFLVAFDLERLNYWKYFSYSWTYRVDLVIVVTEFVVNRMDKEREDE